MKNKTVGKRKRNVNSAKRVVPRGSRRRAPKGKDLLGDPFAGGRKRKSRAGGRRTFTSKNRIGRSKSRRRSSGKVKRRRASPKRRAFSFIEHPLIQGSGGIASASFSPELNWMAVGGDKKKKQKGPKQSSKSIRKGGKSDSFSRYAAPKSGGFAGDAFSVKVRNRERGPKADAFSKKVRVKQGGSGGDPFSVPVRASRRGPKGDAFAVKVSKKERSTMNSAFSVKVRNEKRKSGGDPFSKPVSASGRVLNDATVGKRVKGKRAHFPGDRKFRFPWAAGPKKKKAKGPDHDAFVPRKKKEKKKGPPETDLFKKGVLPKR